MTVIRAAKQQGITLPILSNSSPPLAYSRKRYSVSTLRRCPKNLMTLSWLSIRCMQIC